MRHVKLELLLVSFSDSAKVDSYLSIIFASVFHFRYLVSTDSQRVELDVSTLGLNSLIVNSDN